MVKRANREDYFKLTDEALSSVLGGTYHMQGFLEGDDELKAYEKKKRKAVAAAPVAPVVPKVVQPADPEPVQPPEIPETEYSSSCRLARIRRRRVAAGLCRRHERRRKGQRLGPLIKTVEIVIYI